ncbi:MAG: MBL fold metallo-hydrolase [Pseudomonadota bacterium]
MNFYPINRRVVLTGLGAAILTSVRPFGTRADVVTTQKVQVGEITVTAISDGYFDLPAGAFSNIGSAKLENIVRIGATMWVVSTPTRQILVDAGSGTFLKGKYPATGQMASRLAIAGVDPGKVSDVIITHMHADHIGGLIEDGEKLFGSAELHVSETEWKYWMAEDRPSNVPAGLKPLATLIQSIASSLPYNKTLHPGETDLGEGISLIAVPGHTPGHIGVRLSSGSAQLLLLGDMLISGDLQFKHPEAGYALDSDPKRAAETRMAMFDMIATDGIPFCATHLNGLAPSMLERNGGAFRRFDV